MSVGDPPVLPISDVAEGLRQSILASLKVLVVRYPDQLVYASVLSDLEKKTGPIPMRSAASADGLRASIVASLKELVKRYPDQRVGQIIANAVVPQLYSYSMLDEELERKLRIYLADSYIR